MNDKKAESELKTLYQITGNAADINTILINRGEFRNLRARVAELEAQLESIGAGGIGPLMQAANSKHVEQPLGMVAMPRAVAEQTLDTLNTVEWSVVESCWIVDGERIDSAINTLRAVLEQPDTGIPASEQDDWKLVPVEPTMSMQHAALIESRSHGPVSTGECNALPITYELGASAIVYRAMLDAAPQPPASKDPNWPKLEKPARVGGGTFGIGTSSKHVVDAAQRAHDEHVRAGNLTHEQMVEEERKRRALWDMIHGSPEESKPQFVWQAQGEQEPVAWIENLVGALSYSPHHEAARKLPEGVRFDLYTRPQPSRHPLTLEQIAVAFGWKNGLPPLPREVHAARVVERAHEIGGEV